VGCGRSDLVERATRNEELRREGADTVKGLRGELSKVLAASIIGERQRHRQTAEDGTTTDLVWIKRDEKTTHDFEFLGSIASTVMASETVATDGKKQAVVLVTSTLPGKNQTHLILVQSNDQDRAKDLYEKVKAGLDDLPLAQEKDAAGTGAGAGGKRVKGGGAKGRFMGKVEGKWGKAEDGKVGEIVKAVSGRSCPKGSRMTI
jgi:alanyl-tRNA synthetase/misacylated tRNA(Ala) deacylase